MKDICGQYTITPITVFSNHTLSLTKCRNIMHVAGSVMTISADKYSAIVIVPTFVTTVANSAGKLSGYDETVLGITIRSVSAFSRAYRGGSPTAV